MGVPVLRIALGVVLVVFLDKAASAAHLTPETIAAWDEEVGKVRAQLERESKTPDKFLAGLAPAYIVESPEPSGCPISDGLLHHWFGTEFIPRAHLAALLSVMQDYDAYIRTFPPAVVESHLVSHDGDVFNYHVKFIQKELGTKSGLLADFQSRYVSFDSRSGYIATEATRFTEIQNPGKSDERQLSFAEAKGFIEKSFSVLRYRDTDQGILIRIESITLSRDVPNSIRWLVSPFIRRFARQTMSSTLDRIKARVLVTEPAKQFANDHGSTGRTASLAR